MIKKCLKVDHYIQTIFFFKQQFSQQNVHQMLAIVHSYVMLTPTYTISLLKMCHVTHCHGNGGHIGFDKFSTCVIEKVVTQKLYTGFEWNKLQMKI